ncbi:DUF11 domain-containing protein [Streptomyces sp. NPDC059982]|uniref:DUF11 domain-containing protein n=1 Tax=unclassified Streptomyces TaxID=2593676 RepID=UPI003684E28A
MPRTARKRPGGVRRRALGTAGVVAAYGLLPLAPSAAAALGDAGAVAPGPRTSAEAAPSVPAGPAVPAVPAVPSAPASASTAASASASASAEEGAGDAPAPGGADLVVAGALRAGAPASREQREGGGAAAAASDTFDYLLTVTNRGPSTARQVRVTDRLPASLEFVGSRDGCTANGRTVVCGPLDALAVGASHKWVITVRLSAGYRGDGKDIVNEAVVGAETSDPDAHNNTASMTGLEIPPGRRVADLSLRKTAQLAPGRRDVRPGEKFTYLISVRNQGPGTARQVAVTDRLPASLVLLSSPDDCTLPRGEDRLVVCPPRERLAAGETAEFRITVRVVAGAGRAHSPGGGCVPVENVARVTSASVDPDPSDNANPPGTTGPGGGRLCLVSDRDEDHHHGGDHGHGDDHDDGHHGDGHGRGDHGEDHGREDHGRDDHGREDHGRDDHHGQDHHGGRGDLADSGARVPQWLLWLSASLVAGGAVLRTAFRARS